MSNKAEQEQQFVRLVKASQGIIHKVCRMYCDSEEHRKDLFQEIVIELWKSFPSYRGEAKFSTWMYRVALNIAIQDFRKEKKRKLLFFEAYDYKEPTNRAGPDFEDERLQRMHQAIAGLDKIERAIIMLYLDRKSNEEIAAIIGITQNYVRVKMSRIKQKLAKKINHA